MVVIQSSKGKNCDNSDARNGIPEYRKDTESRSSSTITSLISGSKQSRFDTVMINYHCVYTPRTTNTNKHFYLIIFLH